MFGVRHVHAGVAIVVGLATATAWGDNGVAGFLRSVTGALGGVQQAPSPAPAQQTAVLGVRGIDDVDSKQSSATANSGADMRLVDEWSASAADAERAAAAKGLVARPVSLASSSGGSAP